MELNSTLDGKKVGFEVGPSGVRPNRQTIVFVHGSGGSRASWKNQLEGLGGDFNTIALELPGHGQTPGPLLPSVQEMAAWVGRVVESWDLSPAPILAGHSVGGAVAIEAGLVQGSLFSGLILIGTGARMAVNPLIFEGFEKDYIGSLKLVTKWAVAKSAPEVVGRELYDQLAANEPAVLINDFRACDNFDRREDAERISLPTLIVCGDQDKLTTLELSKYLKEKVPGSVLVPIQNAGHDVMAEQPEAFNRAVRDFLNGIG